MADSIKDSPLVLYIGFYKSKGKVLWNLVINKAGIVNSFTIPAVPKQRMANEIIHELRERKIKFDVSAIGNTVMTLYEMSLLKNKAHTLPIKGTLFSKWHGLAEVIKHKKGMIKYEYNFNSDVSLWRDNLSLPDLSEKSN